MESKELFPRYSPLGRLKGPLAGGAERRLPEGHPLISPCQTAFLDNDSGPLPPTLAPDLGDRAATGEVSNSVFTHSCGQQLKYRNLSGPHFHYSA